MLTSYFGLLLFYILYLLTSVCFYIFRLAKEEELVAARKKADELEKDNIEMATKLSKKEQELDLRTLEKVSLCSCELATSI